VTRDSRQKNSQFPTFVAAHQAEVRGPQVENRCFSLGWVRDIIGRGLDYDLIAMVILN